MSRRKFDKRKQLAGFSGEVSDTLKNYAERIEKAQYYLSSLEAQKKILSEEVSGMKEKRNTELKKLEDELTPLKQKIQSNKTELTLEETRIIAEKDKLDKELKVKQDEIVKSITEEEKRYQAMLKSHVEQIGLVNKQKTEWLESNKILIDENNKLKLWKEEKEKEFNSYIKQLNQKELELNDSVKNLAEKLKKETELHEVKNKEKEKLIKELEELKQLTLKKETDLKSYLDKENAIIDKLLTDKKTELVKLEKEVQNVNKELTPLRVEFNETKKILVGFSNKQEDLMRREKILKKKYEDAGFPF